MARIQSSQSITHRETPHAHGADRRALALAMLLCAVLAVMAVLPGQADARPIRIEGGGAEWSPETVPTTAPVTVPFGFTVNLFGTMFSSLSVGPTGAVTLNGTAQPFSISPALEVFSATLVTPLFGGTITDGVRICVGCNNSDDPEKTSFQLAFFDLGGGKFVAEFNVNTLLPGGVVPDPVVGFDNGSGTLLDLLAFSGATAVYGTGVPEFTGACLNAFNAVSLACNSFIDPGLAGFGTDVFNYFALDDNDDPAVGRYAFLIDNTQANQVPEPGTGALFLAGLAALGALRRQRRHPGA